MVSYTRIASAIRGALKRACSEGCQMVVWWNPLTDRMVIRAKSARKHRSHRGLVETVWDTGGFWKAERLRYRHGEQEVGGERTRSR